MTGNSLLTSTPIEVGHPRRVLTDDGLSTTDKIRLLEDWRLDLLEKLRASEENMPSAIERPGDVAERLRQVTEALAILREHL